MGYYKQFKHNLKERINGLLEEWIAEQENPDGNKVWDKYNSISGPAADFSTYLHDRTAEAESKVKDSTFEVWYDSQTQAGKITIKCPTSQHAKILFQREHPDCTITHIEDVTDKIKE